MNTNKILIGGLIGFVVTFLLGFLIYGNLMTDFFNSNMGSATGVMRSDEEMQWIPLILGHVTIGLLLALILGKWAGISTFSSGATAGAMIGFLVSASHNLIGYGTTNISNLTGCIGDIVISTIIMAIAGGVVAWYFGRGKEND